MWTSADKVGGSKRHADVLEWSLNGPQKSQPEVSSFHRSKVEFVCLFFGRNVSLRKSFQLF